MHQSCESYLDYSNSQNQIMNVKRFLLLPGALALALSYAPMLPVAAQTPSAPTGNYQKRGINLNLTDAQKAQLKQIRESTRSQIDAILTSEQKAQLAAAKQQRQQGQKPQKNWAALNLTAEQKTQMRAIRADAKQKMNAVLTAEQRQQLQQQRQQMRQKHQQMRQNSQQAPQ